ncbi:MAG TPA: isoprenylcysteine carboxylmethyltransferase family protein [Anaerolineales bacterium]|nr:isoprenylcysteine carboxylmethyltransferase family protein [Anaerolineales bacterium]
MKSILKHLGSFIAPILVGFVFPLLILLYEHHIRVHPAINPSVILLVAGLLICLGGLALVIATIRMFILIGDGTIMPWDPTRKLIVVSLYGYVRNPMILSLIILQLGEAVLFASYGIALLAIFNFILNTLYFIYSEEPGLAKRFGEEYLEYKKNVPRWIPRLKPWRPA